MSLLSMSVVPLFLFDLLDGALEWVLGGSGRTTAVLVLLIAVVYFRKALGLGSFLANWVGKTIFTLIVLIALLVTGIIPHFNLDAAMALLDSTLEVVEAAMEVSEARVISHHRNKLLTYW